MRRILQFTIGIGGAAAVIIGLLHIILGPQCIPGSIPVNATLDSEDRFFASIFLGYGLALLGCVQSPETKKPVLRFLLLIFLLGGLARLVSVLATGWPHPFFIAMTGIEITLPLALLGIIARLPREDQRPSRGDPKGWQDH